jgi:tetratricopeptide (TPR) repeat protein
MTMLRPTIFIAAVSAMACAPYPQRINQQTVLANNESVEAVRVPTNTVPAGVAERPESAAFADAASEGRALLAQGDALAGFGKFDEALDRYNRAGLLLPTEPLIDFKVARLLDLQMQPREASMRYQRFLQQLDLERIKVQGEANAALAEAIALAQQRLIVLDKR